MVKRIWEYISDRVFSGKRRIEADRLDKLRSLEEARRAIKVRLINSYLKRACAIRDRGWYSGERRA